ncbi:MAG: hypothetical protein ABJN22_02980 [Litorimonas sp.]
MKTMKTTLSALAIFAIAGPSLAADFATLDTNTDGQVSFDEYKSAALTEGKTVTLAAQEFTRMAQGDAVLTQDEFFLGVALADEPYALQPGLVSEPLGVESAATDYEPMMFVEPVETSPDATEMVEPPVEIEDAQEGEESLNTPDMKDLPAPVIMEKAMDVDPAVAGEVETSIEDATDTLGNNTVDDVTPIEEVEIEQSNLSPELDLEPDSLDDEIEMKDDIGLETTEAEDIESEDID